MNEIVMKYLIIGHAASLEAFLQGVQEGALAEFIDTRCHTPLTISEDAEKLLDAINVLKKCPVLPQRFTEVKSPVELATLILTLHKELSDIEETIALIDNEIVRIEPLGDVSMETLTKLEDLSDRTVQFFCRKHYKQGPPTEIPHSFVYISSNFDLDYYMSLSKEPIAPEGFILVEMHKSLRDLRADRENLLQEKRKIHQELLEQAAFNDFLRHALTEKANSFELDKARNSVCEQFDGSLFVLQAWVPASRIKSLFQIAEKHPIAIEEVALDEDETPPVSLKNAGFSRIGQDLVQIYDTPSSQDKDPSFYVLAAFALFFAMIIADAGYGLIYLAIALFIRWKAGVLHGLKKRVLTLFIFLSVSATVWGVFTGAFFSIQMAPTNPLQKISIIHYLAEKKAAYHMTQNDETYRAAIKDYPMVQGAKTPNELFEAKGFYVDYDLMEEFHKGILAELALFVGMIHLIISFCRNLYRFVGGIGWIAVLVGGYLYCPTLFHMVTMVNYLGFLNVEAAAQTGLQLLGVGLAMAVILSLIQNGLKGISEILRSIQVFGDILSYMRLYALGLASMTFAATFNALGESASASLGLVAGALIIFLGHGINIALAMMGGIIHGLRLNFLEWYHYCFEGSGRPFRPLRRLDQEF